MRVNETYVLVSPCRDEAEFLNRCISSVVNQSVRPTLWVIVDDGSTDATPAILERLAASVPFIKVVRLESTSRQLGAGVVAAFNAGLEVAAAYDPSFICKLDTDIVLPRDYFRALLTWMSDDLRLGHCSGKPYYMRNGRRVSERIGDDVSVGASKFYRVACLKEMGGLTSSVMWDGIDVHAARMRGWRVASSGAVPELWFEHLRPMGSSDRNILVGRMRWGMGQYFMGTDPLWIGASAAYRLPQRPVVVGSLAMLAGYLLAWIRRRPRYDAPGFRAFLRRYQRLCLRVGKERACAQIEKERSSLWRSEAGCES
jgi:poly-beta-1,6-N-acetyl-D-glucosamine synthase